LSFASHRRLNPRSVDVGFVMDEVALGYVFSSEKFGFSLSSSFHERCSVVIYVPYKTLALNIIVK